MKVAIVTGITGKNGSYLASYFLIRITQNGGLLDDHPI